MSSELAGKTEAFRVPLLMRDQDGRVEYWTQVFFSDGTQSMFRPGALVRYDTTRRNMAASIQYDKVRNRTSTEQLRREQMVNDNNSVLDIIRAAPGATTITLRPGVVLVGRYNKSAARIILGSSGGALFAVPVNFNGTISTTLGFSVTSADFSDQDWIVAGQMSEIRLA